MRLFVAAVAVCALCFASEANAQSRSYTSRGYTGYTYRGQSSSTYSSPSSSQPFLYRGHNPGHIFGNTVRRMVWGANYGNVGSGGW